jgi:carbon-monoxide dehydrogenase medium subunit
MLRPFALHQTTSARAASALLAELGEEARLYAGGTELLLAMKAGLLAPGHLIDVKHIPDIATIDVAADGVLRIGAAATHQQIERSDLVRERFPVLAEMESKIANVRVRGTGTLGGNLSFAEPHADPGALLLIHEARVRLEGESARELPVDDYFVGPFEVAAAPDEVLTRIDVPPLPPGSGAAYERFVTLEWPSVGVAASLTPSDDGRAIADARIAVGCVGPRPIRARDAEARLTGTGLDELTALLDEIGVLAGADVDVIEDRAGPADYKRHLIGVLTKRALRLACTRARESLAS